MSCSVGTNHYSALGTRFGHPVLGRVTQARHAISLPCIIYGARVLGSPQDAGGAHSAPLVTSAVTSSTPSPASNPLALACSTSCALDTVCSGDSIAASYRLLPCRTLHKNRCSGDAAGLQMDMTLHAGRSMSSYPHSCTHCEAPLSQLPDHSPPCAAGCSSHKHLHGALCFRTCACSHTHGAALCEHNLSG